MNKLSVLILSIVLFIFSCEKDEPKVDIPQNKIVYYISNEGAFGYENASLSLYYPEDKKLINKVFKTTNKRGIGDVLQSTYIYNNKLFMMVNASSKIEIAKAESIEELGVINNILLPRYMVAKEKKGYISSWGNGGQIKIIDTDNFTVIDSVKTGTGPEKLLLDGNNLVVCNAGGFSVDSTISIIDISNNSLVKNVVIGDIPIDIIKDETNQIWVLCKGKIIYDDSWQIVGHTASKLVKLTSNYELDTEYELFTEEHPSQLAISKNKKTLFIGGGYGFNGIYHFSIDNKILDTNKINNNSFYGISTVGDGKIYGFESPDFSTSGKMIIMDENGTEIKSKTVGVGPNAMIK